MMSTLSTKEHRQGEETGSEREMDLVEEPQSTVLGSRGESEVTVFYGAFQTLKGYTVRSPARGVPEFFCM